MKIAFVRVNVQCLLKSFLSGVDSFKSSVTLKAVVRGVLEMHGVIFRPHYISGENPTAALKPTPHNDQEVE